MRIRGVVWILNGGRMYRNSWSRQIALEKSLLGIEQKSLAVNNKEKESPQVARYSDVCLGQLFTHDWLSVKNYTSRDTGKD